MKKIISVIFAIIMLLGAVGHVVSPEMYAPLIPSFIPEFIAHLFSIVSELGVGIALLVPKYRKYGGLGFMILMVIFLPIHVWDLLREEPFIGSKTIAVVRLFAQFLMIYTGWWIYKKYEN
jgi:uncharacterized membrane protein